MYNLQSSVFRVSGKIIPGDSNLNIHLRIKLVGQIYFKLRSVGENTDAKKSKNKNCYTSPHCRKSNHFIRGGHLLSRDCHIEVERLPCVDKLSSEPIIWLNLHNLKQG